jgi:hypothetical protein
MDERVRSNMTFGLMTDAFHRSRDALKQCLRKDTLWGGLKLYIQEGINTTRKRTDKVSWITLNTERVESEGFQSHRRSMQQRLSPLLCATDRSACLSHIAKTIRAVRRRSAQR